MKKLLLALLTGSMLLTLAGCGSTGDVADTVGDAVEDVGTAFQAEGREYGQTYELKQDESMKTAFFDLTVNSVQLAATFEDYLPDSDTHQFLIVNVDVSNTFADSDTIPMYYNDFELTWEALGEETITPELVFAEDQLPDEYELLKAETRTGNLIFEVPNDISEFDFKFYELWDDDFEGNTFWIHLTAEAATAPV